MRARRAVAAGRACQWPQVTVPCHREPDSAWAYVVRAGLSGQSGSTALPASRRTLPFSRRAGSSCRSTAKADRTVACAAPAGALNRGWFRRRLAGRRYIVQVCAAERSRTLPACGRPGRRARTHTTWGLRRNYCQVLSSEPGRDRRPSAHAFATAAPPHGQHLRTETCLTARGRRLPCVHMAGCAAG